MKIKNLTNNFIVEMGDSPHAIRFEFIVHKTILNQIKWWLFCKVFPFRIVSWRS